MKPILLIVASLAISLNLNGQDIASSKIEWSVDSLVDLRTNGQFAYSCVFKTFSDHIEWVQNEGFKSTIDINSTSGAWIDIDQPGSYTLLVSYEGENGQMVFSREGSLYKILLRFGPENAPTLNQEFLVSSVTQIP